MQSEGTPSNPFQTPLIQLLSAPKYRWLRHVLFILLGLLLAFKGDMGDNQSISPQAKSAILLVDGITFIIIMGLMYFMLYVLIPQLLFRSKLLLFSLLIIAIITLTYFTVWFLDLHVIRPANPAGFQHIDLSLVQFIQISAVGAVLFGAVIGLAVFKKWIGDVQRMNELQQTNLKTELEQLKSQVNPHFLFNTLNNLLVLTKTDAQKATQVLLGLSDLLRYQLYDSAREKIMLSKDIAFITNFLELEKLRKNDFDFNIKTEGNLNGLAVPPFLFIPFIENAVKHGASTVGHSYLNIHFRVNENQLSFSAENSKPLVKQNGIGGIGLKNIQRRLELLYPQQFTLQIKDESDKYRVHLILPI